MYADLGTHTCIHKTKASTACLFPFSAISHQNLRAQLLQFANCKAKHGHDAPKFKTITWNLKSITWKLICYHYNYNILIRASFGSFHVINSYTYGEMSTHYVEAKKYYVEANLSVNIDHNNNLMR